MLLSVAMCTYNGEAYLEAQLASISAQSRRPDELIVCDDSSSDATLAIARQFAEKAPFPVHIEVNPVNLGSTRNFDKAIRLCRGEIIALADQDDVWLPEKLAMLERTFDNEPDCGLAFTDAEMVDPQLRPLGYRLWDAIHLYLRERQLFRAGHAFALLLRRYRVTGATMAFRSRHKDLILPIPPQWIHDAWIALLIAAVDLCVPVEQPLIRYRQHATQQLGERKRGLYQQYLVAKRMSQTTYQAVAHRYTQACERLRLAKAPEDRLSALAAKITHFQRRTEMHAPGIWRLPLILRELWSGRYSRYSLGWKSLAQDLFLN
ncbi:MAG TPA: glycosyltransferase family 2 protein [Gemmataceae bacterium]|nr:glycosyltransferase family 2 protein [Gemmataceae bacterium]